MFLECRLDELEGSPERIRGIIKFAPEGLSSSSVSTSGVTKWLYREQLDSRPDFDLS